MATATGSATRRPEKKESGHTFLFEGKNNRSNQPAKGEVIGKN